MKCLPMSFPQLALFLNKYCLKSFRQIKMEDGARSGRYLVKKRRNQRQEDPKKFRQIYAITANFKFYKKEETKYKLNKSDTST